MQPLTGPADVVNRALQFVGGYNNNQAVTGTPPNFDSTPIGKAAGVLYYGAVQTAGRKFGYDFSRNVATLVLTGNSPPLPGYTYEYVYPSNGIQLRGVIPATLADANDPRPQRSTVGNNLAGSVQAAGNIAFSSNPHNGDTITLNGRVFTFVTSGATQSNYESNIGGDTAASITLLWALLTGSATYLADTGLNVATYSHSNPPDNLTATLGITYKTAGTFGNFYTLAASAPSRAVVSAATLTGGAILQIRVIWTNVDNALGVITNQPPEYSWDAMFTEEVVRLLASGLSLATAGKPDTAEAFLEQAAAFGQAGAERTDT